MRKVSLCVTALLMGGLSAGGCTNGHTNQRSWHDRLRFATHAVDASTRRAGCLFTDKQLYVMAERPDYRLLPDDLEDRLITDPAHREHIMGELLKEYQTYALRPANRVHASESGVPEGSTGFANCWLWMYDESRHFDRPLPSSEWAGFHCICFYVQQGRVIGATSFAYWPPVETEPGCRPLKFFDR